MSLLYYGRLYLEKRRDISSIDEVYERTLSLMFIVIDGVFVGGPRLDLAPGFGRNPSSL
jgi:hypothetical protein